MSLFFSFIFFHILIATDSVILLLVFDSGIYFSFPIIAEF